MVSLYFHWSDPHALEHVDGNEGGSEDKKQNL